VSKRGTSPGAAYLVTGSDEVLVANEVRELITEVLGDRDASLVVEEKSVDDLEDGEPGPIIDAFMTPPFLVDRRIVVVRRAGKLTADAARQVAGALAEPPPGAILILSGDGGTPTPTLKKAVAAVGEVISVGTKTAGEKKSYLADHLRQAPVRLNAAATKILTDHLGEDLGRLNGILETLAAAYGQDVAIDPSMLAPYLGQKGQVPIWDLTDKVEAGDAAGALGMVARMMGPGGVSAHVLTASFDNRFSQLARLDGADVRSGDDVVAVLGGSPFVAKKLFALSSRISHEGVVRALDLIGEADLALKGGSGLDERLVIEVLVARLAHLCSSGR
jgi:DNA polymerase III delta subunit